jgi:transketolase
MVGEALSAAELLAADGVSARVINMATVRPVDRESVLEAAEETGAIVTVEEHSVHCGMGSAVAEVVVSGRPVPVSILGVPGVFAPTGSHSWLCRHFGLTAEGIRDAAREVIERKRRP